MAYFYGICLFIYIDVENQTCCETGTESYGSLIDSRVTIIDGNPAILFLFLVIIIDFCRYLIVCNEESPLFQEGFERTLMLMVLCDQIKMCGEIQLPEIEAVLSSVFEGLVNVCCWPYHNEKQNGKRKERSR